MKLTTQKGQLDLPNDFSLTLERTNPLLSDQGDASVPATLPSSPRNLEVIGHHERLDRARRYDNKVEAILEVGPIQKHGQLVIESVHRNNGINASFAIDNSDLYAQSRSKTLKEIFTGLTQSFQSIDEAVTFMWHIYGGDVQTEVDYTIFPVIVSPYEDEDENTVYQYNNEIGPKGELIYESRSVREGDILMSVPKGYGIAPFLKLYRLIDLLFERLDYTVKYNCLSANEYKCLTIVHNCSDCLVTPVLKYADMVPSCTLSEFLEWLEAKFHVQPIVNSDTKEVRVVMMEQVLGSTPDADITAKMEGSPTVSHSPTRRIVLTPTNSIEGSSPAAETFDQLIEKHGGYIAMYEPLFEQLNGSNPSFMGGLLLRKSTGVFYEQGLHLVDAKPVLNAVGTNHFVYDRANSEDTEEFNQIDVMPLMICEGNTHRVAPYIGERLHCHTSYQDKKEDGKQDIIVVRAITSANNGYRTSGTTQQFIPDASTGGNSFGYDLTTYGLYNSFWSRYNELLLNNETMAKMNLKLSVAEFLQFNTAALKLCHGQRLLPEKISAAMGNKIRLTEASFVLLQAFQDATHDETIPDSKPTRLGWMVKKNEQAIAEILLPAGNILDSYYVTYPYNNGVVYPGPPLYEREERNLTVLGDVTIGYEDQAGGHTQWQTFEAQQIPITLIAR